MARMKTGRLTPKTTTPQKNNGGPTNPTSKPSTQGAWDKYESDVKAYNNYDSELKAYNEKKKSYDESKLKAPKSYALLGGKQNTRSLAGSELADFNKRMGSNYSKVEVNKDLKKAGEKDLFFGEMAKPAPPVRRERPDPTNLPLDKMSYKSAGKANVNRKLAGPKKEKSSEGWFGDYVPTTKNTSNKQLKQFASYASKTGLNESFIGKSKEDIGEYKNEMKSQRKSYAKEGNLAGIKSTTADIRQAKNAAKFIGSKNPLDQPGMAKGYRKEQEIEAYRKGLENATNRNTIKSQVDRLKKLR